MLSLINNQEYSDRKEFIKHLRENGLSLKEYCIKYYDRKDLLTGRPLEYKDDLHYINSFFENRENMVNYLLKEGSDNLGSIVAGRKNIKSLKYAPSTAEARTCIFPSPALIHKLGLDYNKVCATQGLEPRYSYDGTPEKTSDPLHILVDTREQNPLKLSCKTSVSKLDVGDYTCQNHFHNSFIERKSLEDFCGTMSQGYDRFKEEVARAAELGFYLVVLVEEKLETLLQLNVANTHKFIKAPSEFYCARMRGLCETFNNIQFLFVGGRYESSRVLVEILRIKGGPSKFDLQFLYDSKKI
jgi:hypothetical protein